MLNKKTAALWIAAFLLNVLAGTLYKLSFLHHSLLPDSGRFPWEIVESTDAEGSSISRVHGNTLTVRSTLSPKLTYPFANINFIVGEGHNNKFVDWSSYSWLQIKIRCEPENVLTFSLGTYDERVTRPDEPESYRPSEHSFSCVKEWSVVDIDLTRLNTPDWWLDRYNLHVSDKDYSLEYASSFSILHSAQTPVGQEYSYELAAITLKGRNAFILYSAWVAGILAIAVFLFTLHQVRLQKLIHQKVTTLKQDSQALVYQPVPTETRKDKHKNRVLQYLATEYTNPDLTLESAISTLGINRIKINEILREQYGLTFSAYLSKLRMTEAARLLVEKDLSVAEIGYSVGYKTASYFNRAFKKEYDCTPNEFRRYTRAR